MKVYEAALSHDFCGRIIEREESIMTEEMVTRTCPECGASFGMEANQAHAFCVRCGASLLIQGDGGCISLHNGEEEARLAELDREIELKELELEAKRLEDDIKTRPAKIRSLLLLAMAGFAMIVLFYLRDDIYVGSLIGGMILILATAGIIVINGGNGNSNRSRSKEDLSDKVRVPTTIAEFNKKDFGVISKMFVAAGFTNVRCIALNDLKVGVAKKPDTVESISINGTNITGGGGLFPKDAAVIISYHSMNRPPRTEEKQFGE